MGLIIPTLDTAAEQVVAAVGASARTRLRAASVDVTDASALASLLSGADVVLNTTGPFYRLGAPVLRTAIEAGATTSPSAPTGSRLSTCLRSTKRRVRATSSR